MAKTKSASTSAKREVEAKYLIETPEQLAAVAEELKQLASPTWESQLNHYFFGGRDTVLDLKEHLKIDSDTPEAAVSIRTRQVNGEPAILVFKFGANPENGTDRIEQEYKTKRPIDELDALIEKLGGTCRSKWSRERIAYTTPTVIFSLDKNSGYGHLLELEAGPELADNPNALEILDTIAGNMGLKRLPEDRLQRMFAYYEEHWREYYGTTNVFRVG